jgi:hypothetical protein
MKTTTKNLDQAYSALYEVTSTLTVIGEMTLGSNDETFKVAFVGTDANWSSIQVAIDTATVICGLTYEAAKEIQEHSADLEWEHQWTSVRAGRQWVLVQSSNRAARFAANYERTGIALETMVRRARYMKTPIVAHLDADAIEWSTVKAEIVAIEAKAADIF